MPQTGGRSPWGSPKPGGGENSIPAQLLKWAEKFRKNDPLTNELINTDQEFTINVLVYKGNTPKKDIPKEYGGEEKKDGDKAKEKPQPEPPPARPDQ
jgi:hypothetical protein